MLLFSPAAEQFSTEQSCPVSEYENAIDGFLKKRKER